MTKYYLLQDHNGGFVKSFDAHLRDAARTVMTKDIKNAHVFDEHYKDKYLALIIFKDLVFVDYTESCASNGVIKEDKEHSINAHYQGLKIQPFEYSYQNNLDALQHTAIKYITRFRQKGGLRDLLAAKHTIDTLISFEYLDIKQ